MSLLERFKNGRILLGKDISLGSMEAALVSPFFASVES